MNKTIIFCSLASVLISCATAAVTTYVIMDNNLYGSAVTIAPEPEMNLQPEEVIMGGSLDGGSKNELITEYQRLLREEVISTEAREFYLAEIQRLQSAGE